jgi:hypothetical protein
VSEAGNILDEAISHTGDQFNIAVEFGVQAIAERVSLERAFRFGMAGGQIGFSVHVVKHSHRTYHGSFWYSFGLVADQASGSSSSSLTVTPIRSHR